MKKSLLTTLFIVILTQSAGAMQQPEGPNFNGAIRDANASLVSLYLRVLKNEKLQRPEEFVNRFRNYMNTYNNAGFHPLYALIMQTRIKTKKRLKILEQLLELGANTKVPYKRHRESIYNKIEQLAKEKHYYKMVFVKLSTKRGDL